MGPAELARGFFSTYTKDGLRACHWLLVLRLLSLFALGTSVALLLDYSAPVPHFCADASGCGAVRDSGWGYVTLPFGTRFPWLPAFGTVNFLGVFVLSAWGSERLQRKILAPLIYVSAGGAVGLIGLQAYLGSFCYLCMMVDTAALASAGVAFVLGKKGWEQARLEEKSDVSVVDPARLRGQSQSLKRAWRDDSQVYDAPNSPVVEPPSDPVRMVPSAWAGFLGIALLAPFGFAALVHKTEVPSVIAELYEPGEITVVEFFDFQCPHCRNLSPRLAEVVSAFPEAHLRYSYVPLPGHQFAKDAARIAICAAEQGKEKEVNERFFQTEDLRAETLKKLAEGIVPNPAALDACLATDVPDKRIFDDTRRIKAADFKGLPTTYVGGILILGAEEDLVYRDALEKVRDGRDKSGMDPWAYWASILALVAIVFLTGRVRPESAMPSSGSVRRS